MRLAFAVGKGGPMQTVTIEPRNPTSPGVGPMRIIMADDDRNEHLLMALAAGDAKHSIQIDFVDDGCQLLEALANQPHVALPDLILLDLRMPRMDGWATLKELRKEHALRHLPIVVFTSSSRVEDEESAYHLGAFHFETKPSTFGELVQFFDRISEIASTAYPTAP